MTVENKYETACIYKLCCNDDNINSIYIGSTRNFNLRRSQHKYDCKKNDIHVYKFIRENGGWSNWTMIKIEDYAAKDKIDLYKREKYYINLLNAKLNLNCPYMSEKEIKERDRIYNKKYRQDHKIETSIYNKMYREQNKEKFREKATCECGKIVCKYSLSSHRKTKRHKLIMAKKATV